MVCNPVTVGPLLIDQLWDLKTGRLTEVQYKLSRNDSQLTFTANNVVQLLLEVLLNFAP